MYQSLTKRQKEIFEFIKFFYKSNKMSPTLKEIQRYLNLRSVSTVHQHIEQLCKKGYIFKDLNKRRGLQVIDPTLKRNHFVEIQILNEIYFNKPLKFLRNPTPILVNRELLSEGGRYFASVIHGNRLIDEGFFDEDILVIREQSDAQNGDLVLALVQNKLPTVKKYYKEKKRIRLQPLNPKAKARYYKHIQIKGKVVSLIRIFEKKHSWKKF